MEQMARPTGFEPVTFRLEGGCSIQLSYGRVAGDAVAADSGAVKSRVENQRIVSKKMNLRFQSAGFSP